MWKEVLLFFVVRLLVLCVADNFVCDGTWDLHSITKCEDPEQYEYDLDVQKRMINRTHDGISVEVDLKDAITAQDYGVHLEFYKKVDGGYRYSDNLDSDSMCAFCEQMSKANFQKVLEMAGVDPPECPIPKGMFTVKDFTLDYTQLPSQAKCGNYKAIAYLIYQGKKIACAVFYADFNVKDDDDDDYE